MNAEYAKHDYSQAYGELISCCRHLSKDNVLQPYKFKTDLGRDENPNPYVFDIRHQI